MKPLAIIPARGGSKRFPRKNIALLAGKPLVAWAVEAARKSGIFECICVSSEDSEILHIAEEAGADLALPRPPELATDTAQMKHVCLHLLDHFSRQGQPFDVFALLSATSPLRTPESIRGGYEMLMTNDCDSVMSVVKCERPPQQCYRIAQGALEPFLGVEVMRKRSQELEPLYYHDSAFIFMKSDAFRLRPEWCESRTLPYVVSGEYSIDIDAPMDLELAEFLLQKHDQRHSLAWSSRA